MASWKKTIATPFKKACTFFNQQPPRDHKNKSQTAEQENRIMDLHGEVMACGYEDVQVMWSILDKSKSTACNITSS
ncbi:hypothetical protein AAZX31_15G175300 [Glycine max]|uniref:Uncharacterized protein n=2 Tax=Glycine subgen. Soja TaxID=1462606 RepID=I1MHM1_SOYBN|nr:uncharacterized protein LOC100779101 [Glycine max]XP_028203471.1 uncharacterized protein LOC114387477 [Glycine soja]KAG4946665.1 hypothetical protein JHK87_042672 [Glycine soja]KAG4949546.1 hypothetical protein JHK86_042785 [Glycine max]KAG4957040.1 hypothetical protein JHK85_043420 [Glycine max]KAG5105787.1 hypothetical protein JHK82_042757 [Glycine max]KAG5116886.1 hypothetical protein JHK84_042999 [Glycine max]|eukprot:XP_006597899.1 uncharacterized protein LOC100779101 [Glycine max]